jgi:N utilization substance protein B
MGSRRQGRILAFQALYSWEVNPQPLETLVTFAWLDEEKRSKTAEDTYIFARLLISGTIQNIETVDHAISRQLEHWDFSRVAKVDLAILRISVYSLLFQKDIPSSVTIDEAINISKMYGTNDSYRFINGILDGIVKAQKTDNEHLKK